MGTLIAGLAVLIIIGLAGFKVISDRKKGQSCPYGCAGCPKAANGSACRLVGTEGKSATAR
jgi:hypothetical protein